MYSIFAKECYVDGIITCSMIVCCMNHTHGLKITKKSQPLLKIKIRLIHWISVFFMILDKNKNGEE